MDVKAFFGLSVDYLKGWALHMANLCTPLPSGPKKQQHQAPENQTKYAHKTKEI